MTVLTPLETAPETPAAAISESPPDDRSAVAAAETQESATGTRPLNLNLATITAALSCAAAAWLVSRLFVDQAAALGVAGLGVLIALAVGRYSYQLQRRALLQYAILPLSVLAGVVLVAPSVGGGSSSLPALVVQALHNGGLLQAPVSFDPGWRVVIVVLFAGLAALTLVLAISTARPRLAVAVPLPVVLGAALLQPSGSETLLAIPLALLLGALVVAAGADVRRDDQGGAFELRRIARGAGLMLMLMAAIVGLTRVNFLFPDTTRSQVIPAQRPPTSPLESDRVLFAVTGPAAAAKGPWQVGVLDEQDAQGYFLLPPVDPANVTTLDSYGSIQAHAATPRESVTFTVHDLPGHALPIPVSVLRVSGINGQLQWDPRSGTLRLGNRQVNAGESYTVTTATLPNAAQMTASGKPEVAIAALYEAMPAAPSAVQKLLSTAPASGFDRLQFVRQALYSKVIAAGSGSPVGVTPARVAVMLNGGDASPYEITAAEVMLARWAGFPARMGFGFYGGAEVGAAYQIHPSDGAAWLEVYFRGYGWVPIVGTPPRAETPLDSSKKNQAHTVVGSDVLDLQVYVPVRETSLLPLYEVTRYWVLVLLPIVLGGVALLIFYPAGLKLFRSARRRRWARHRGLLPRLVVAYVELRDRCHDLNIGDPIATPLEFLAALDPDAEHAEMAWLYTRAVWGDISRDLRAGDVRQGVEMAESLRRRVSREQPFINRVVALASRASLRHPYSDEVPNTWLHLPPLRLRVLGRRRRAVAMRPATVFSAMAVLVAVAIGVTSCGLGNGTTAAATQASDYPARIIPSQVMEYAVTRQQAAEALFHKPGNAAAVIGGHVYTLRDAVTAEGSLQVSTFAADIDPHDPAEQVQVEQQIGFGSFRTVLFGTVRLLEGFSPDLHFYLWFPPEHRVMELFVFRSQVTDAEAVVRHVIAYQRGLNLPGSDLLSSSAAIPSGVTGVTVPPSPSPRPGGSET